MFRNWPWLTNLAIAGNEAYVRYRYATYPVAKTALCGLIAGALLAAGASQIIKSMLFGLSALDPVAHIATASASSAAALLAMYAPARRAARVDPAVTLRFE